MLSNSIFFMYLIMICLGFQAIVLFILFKKINISNLKKPNFIAGRNFLIVTLVLGILYFITFYSDIVLKSYETSFGYRLFDGIIFYALGYFYIKILETYLDKDDKKTKNLKQATLILFSIFTVLSMLSYGFMLDEFYETSSIVEEIIVVGLELTLVFLVLIFTIVYVKKFNKREMPKQIKILTIIMGVLVNMCNIYNSLIVLTVFLGIKNVSILISFSYGITSIYVILMNIVTFRYLYLCGDINSFAMKIKMIQEIEENGGIENKEEIFSDEEKLNTIIEKYKITTREKEVLELVYKGLTNPEIGEKLYISRHTVKKHLHNIFEKMEISSRVELVHAINKVDIDSER